MSDFRPPPGHRAESALLGAIAEIGRVGDLLHALAPRLNEPRLHATALGLAEAATAVAGAHARHPGPDIADALSGLLTDVRALAVPQQDPESGVSAALESLRGACGQLALATIDGLSATKALGLRPSEPGIALPAETEAGADLQLGHLHAIERRMAATEAALRTLVESSATVRNDTRQFALVNFFVGAIRAELAIGRLQLGGDGRRLNLAGLARAVQAMAGLAGDFLATLRGWADRALPAILDAGKAVGRRVNRVVSGVRAAAYLARRRSTPRTDPDAGSASDPPDTADSALFTIRTLRTMLLRGETPPPKWTPLVDDLDLRGTQVSDLTPLRGLTALQSLDLSGTKVSDLAPLRGLTALQSLHLTSTKVSDLTALRGLTALQGLDLRGTQVSDLTPLRGLTALQGLNLRGTQVNDLTPLRGLTALQSLDLSFARVNDLTPLGGLTALQHLHLTDTQVSDLTPLRGLTALQSLHLRGTQVSDLTPLRGLTALHSLDLSFARVSDLTPLRGLTALQGLNLGYATQVNDLTPLGSLTALQRLDLTGTQVSDLTPLRGLTALKRLDLTGTQVSDVTPLRGLTALQSLDLSGTKVSDLTPLERIVGLGIIMPDSSRRHVRAPSAPHDKGDL